MALPFLAFPPIEHTVNGTVCKFYPLNGTASFAIRNLAKPVLKAVFALFSQNPNDSSLESSEIISGENSQKRTSQAAIASDLAKLRFNQKQDSLETLIEGLLCEPSAKVIATCIMACMKDDYPKGTKTPDQFLEETPLPVIVEMLTGVAKANAKVFDPFKAAVENLVTTIKGRMELLQKQPEASENPGNQ